MEVRRGPGSCGPEPGAHGAPAPLGCGAGGHRGSPGSARPSAPSRARRQRRWPGLSAVQAGEARAGRRQRPAKGLSPRQPFPPGALSTWQRTGAERPSTRGGPCRTCGAHRSPCDRRPSGSLVSHEPGAPPRPAAARPQPRLLPRQRDPGQGPWSPACPRGCHRPLAAVPSGVGMRRGPALSPAGARRACGRRAGSAAERELCRWGRDRLCVPRHRRAAPEGPAGRGPAHLRGP
ncbi:collagen alpha-1(I) chain-like [Corvus hawaiiensis]|uniref:collagen alpha-1(I) chain-like n=1 Tax=Corvus hawaiiensis TaxID=134902 RepID=UPI0020198A98|nr:collagen alpha-1(I) chain-like [Corvus hawaiiensis]